MHCLALYNARTDEEHLNGEYASNDQNPQPTPALCLPPPTTTAATAAPAPAQDSVVLAAEAASPVPAATAVVAEISSPTAGTAADHDPGGLVQWEEQRKLSVEVAVRAIADMLLQAGANVDAVDSEGNTPLLSAAKTGGVALCELLLARGANADARWVNGTTI